MRKTIMIIALPWFVFAQDCIQGSGQTVPFTLQSGARAAWNQFAVPIKQRSAGLAAEATVSCIQSSNGKVIFSVKTNPFPATAVLSVYSVSGKKVFSTVLQGTSSVLILKGLAKGVYYTRIDMPNKAGGLCKFAIAR